MEKEMEKIRSSRPENVSGEVYTIDCLFCNGTDNKCPICNGTNKIQMTLKDLSVGDLERS